MNIFFYGQLMRSMFYLYNYLTHFIKNYLFLKNQPFYTTVKLSNIYGITGSTWKVTYLSTLACRV